MTKKTLKQFAPKGLLSNPQTEQLKDWIKGNQRVVSIDKLTAQAGIAKKTLYNALKKNPDRPFDELKLAAVNKIIQIYNQDILVAKDKIEDEEAKETALIKKRAEKLIKKVGR